MVNMTSRIQTFRVAVVTAAAAGSLVLAVPQTFAAAAAPTADFNKDGKADLAVGVPAYTDGAATGAGAISVVPGAASGPNGASKIFLTQNSTVGGTAIPGTSETGDNFGSATAFGDINGDGYADLAVAASGEDDTTGHNDIGGITLLYGSASGFTADPTMYHLPTALRYNGQACGTKMSIGDFNADGKADVLAFCAGSNSVMTIDGATKAVRTNAVQPSQFGNPLEGSDVAAGDVNGDGYVDAVVTYMINDGGQYLKVVPGTATGLDFAGIATVPNAFGANSLATGDVNGDGVDDVVAGMVGGNFGGQVVAYYGAATGLDASRSTGLGQDSDFVPGSAESSDNLGASVAVADTDGDGIDDVLAGVPGEDLNEADPYDADQGDVLLFKGSSNGLTGDGSALYSTDTTGVPGAAEVGDQLGASVGLADFTGDGRADLAIGSPGENTGDGTVLTLNNSATGIVPTSGLYFGPVTLGMTTGGGFGIGRVLAP
jgi:hypothetical protein